MCNVILAKSKKPITREQSDYLAMMLRLRGRDNYTVFSPDTMFLTYSSNFIEFLTYLEYKFVRNNVTTLLMHSRAIPETESQTKTRPNIYENERFVVAHHGIIPNAEKFNPKIEIDSELLLDIYKDFDYGYPKEWFMKSLEKYPRATTEVIYDKEENRFIIASNFMPLYLYRDDDNMIFSTYKGNGFLSTDPYSIFVVD